MKKFGRSIFVSYDQVSPITSSLITRFDCTYILLRSTTVISYLHFLLDEFGKVSQFVHDFARPFSSEVVASRLAHALGYLQTLASFGKVLLSHLEDCPDPAVLGLLKLVPPLRQLLPDPQNTLPH